MINMNIYGTFEYKYFNFFFTEKGLIKSILFKKIYIYVNKI